MRKRIAVLAIVLGAMVPSGIRAEQSPRPVSEENSVCAVAGDVRDGSGRPVYGATVLLEPAGLFAETDRDGGFCFADVVGGQYRLRVVAPGFQEVELDKVEVRAGRQRVIEVALAPAFRSEVVVTATRTESRLGETPVRTEVVGRDTIRQIGALTLADAVEFTTGVRVENNCQNCNFSQIRLLGLDGAYTQILTDGLATVSSLAQVYGVEHIPARMIERIEVVKGGASAVYGPGAVGGVINVIPHEPRVSGASVESRVGWMGGGPATSFNALADWVPENGGGFLSAYAQVDQVRGLDVDGDGFTEVGKRELEAFGIRFGRLLMGESGRLTVGLQRVTEDRRGGDQLDLPEHEVELAESASTRRTLVDVTFLRAVNSSFDYRLAASYAATDRDTYYGAGGDPNAYGESSGPMAVLDGQVNLHRGAHLVSVGVQASREEMRDSQPAYNRFTDETYTNVGVFLQDQWVPMPGLDVVAGVRVDRHSALDETVASPRLAVRYSPRPELAWRTAVSTGFRAPQLFDEDLHITQVGGEGQVIRNSPDLTRESSRNVLSGLEWTPVTARGTGLFEVNLFHTALRDLFYVIEDDDPFTPEVEFTRVNLGAASVYGVELNAGWSTGPWTVQAGWVEQRGRFREPEPDFGSRDFHRTPDQYGVLLVSARPLPRWQVMAAARYTGPMLVPHYEGFIDEDRLETSPSFLTLDFSLSREVRLGPGRGAPKIEVTAGVKNLTNAYQKDFDQGPDRDAGYIYGPRFPRTVHVGTLLRF